MAAAPSSRSQGKKIVVFGATGRTGRPLVEQALEQGYYVTAVVRCPGKLDIQHPNLQIVQGDICDIESYATSFKDKDAILSAFGSPYHSIFNPTTMYSESMKGIMEAMKRHKVSRLIVVTSWGTCPGPNNHWFMEWFLKPFILNGIIKDMAVMEKMVEESDPSEINYTFVRPAGLTDDPPNDNYKVEEGYCNTNTTMSIPRADVAAFMLECLNSSEYDRKGMAIASLRDK
ncbi:flavin reductase (NADPH)-like [Actinia tenebrosa]|uniref:Flavin reductase (NADPH)-like n=1 Tax=Actinia tenebrosa TaxID=6105 RepID=A0A6P8I3Y4_ACTTE|nr:flavin reductase (NADPH)-like [Actinia tenebrosa]